MESIEERIKIFRENILQGKIEKRCRENPYYGKFCLSSDKAEFNGIVVGAIIPKDENYNLDFYDNNVALISLDLSLKKDLNNDNLRFNINGNRLRLADLSTINEYDYVEDYIDCFSKEKLYTMCEDYDCSPSELPDKLLEDLGIEGMIGDCGIFQHNDNDYILTFDSGWDLFHIIKNVDETKKIIWFDNAIDFVNEIKKHEYDVFGNTPDLTKENIIEIAKAVNNICEKDNVLDDFMNKIEE